MPRQKRTSRVLEKAELRANGLKAIDPNLNFGGTCNLQNMMQLIEELRIKLDNHNTVLAMIDSKKTELDEMEKALSQMSSRLLLGVACKYGKDSIEYMMAGGVRKSDRIRKAVATRRKAAAKAKSSKNEQMA
jgi:hypothetical protein